MPTHRLLLVEDDSELAALVQRLLQQQALVVDRADTIAAARAKLALNTFDAVVLDIMLPDGSGLDLCRELRARHPSPPVLMLSARGDTIDRVLGLEIGADDYLPKPFDAAELLARIRALLRRDARVPPSPATRTRLGALEIDLLARSAVLHGRQMILTGAEFKLLTALSETPGRPWTRDALARTLHPGSYLPSNRSVDVQVARLRKKLQRSDAAHDWVRTVRGEGYVFVVPPAA